MSTIPMHCRRCGMKFAFPASEAVFACPACDALHDRPLGQQETFAGLDRANDKRADGDYAEALQAYQDVLQRVPKSHEALWGLVLCKYGVRYVDDPASRRRMPTLHFLQRKSILSDEDFRRACQYAPEEIAAQYREDAAYIEQVHQALMQGAEEFPDCDVFLCYKGSAPVGKGMAKEYEHAFKLYMHLEKQGFRVFFAHETLKMAAGAKYEAGIFRALHSAKVMLVICSDPANLSTAWVHSEWSRFLKRFYDGENCRLIPLLYDNCDAYRLPQELQRLQCISMSDPDAFEILRENLRKYVPAAAPAPAPAPTQPADAAVAEELLTIEYALTNGRWADAGKWAEALIRKHPRCSQAYFMKLLAKMKIAAPEMLGQCLEPFEEDGDWKWAVRVASDAEKKTLGALLTESLAARDRKRREDEARMWQEEENRRREEKRREEERQRQLEAERRERVRREQEAKRQAEAAELAEKKRREEEARRRVDEEHRKVQEALRRLEEQDAERERKEAEQRRIEDRRLEVQKLQAEQRRISEEAKQKAYQLLKAKKWDEAANTAGKMTHSAEKTLLKLLAKYEASEKKQLATCMGKWYEDALWKEYMSLDSYSGTRYELDECVNKAKAYQQKHQNRGKKIIVFLLTVIPVFALVLLQMFLKTQEQWPLAVEASMLGAVVIAFAAFFFYGLIDDGVYADAHSDDRLFLMLCVTIVPAILVIGLIVAAMVYLPSTIFGVCWWPYAALLLAILMGWLAYHECVYYFILFAIWFVMYIVCFILTGFFDLALLDVCLKAFSFGLPLLHGVWAAMAAD